MIAVIDAYDRFDEKTGRLERGRKLAVAHIVEFYTAGGYNNSPQFTDVTVIIPSNTNNTIYVHLPLPEVNKIVEDFWNSRTKL